MPHPYSCKRSVFACNEMSPTTCYHPKIEATRGSIHRRSIIFHPTNMHETPLEITTLPSFWHTANAEKIPYWTENGIHLSPARRHRIARRSRSVETGRPSCKRSSRCPSSGANLVQSPTFIVQGATARTKHKYQDFRPNFYGG